MEEMKLKINFIREQLHKLMSSKDSTTDEIVELSEELDIMIAQYNEIEKTQI